LGKNIYLITGGCGFIGSCLIREILQNGNSTIINIDKLSYASNPDAIGEVSDNEYNFYKIDLVDRNEVMEVFKDYKPNYVINLAAESHVDRSIDGPEVFIKSNIVGTFNILDLSYQYWRELDKTQQKRFRFLHVSTDEVYGSLNAGKKPFKEDDPYKPNNPYSATKASSDHLVRAWYETYNFPTLVTNTTNNYGPWQFHEKLIPLVIRKCLSRESIPIYGDGEQIRDWIHVQDHIEGILTVLKKGNVGEKYNISSNCQITNKNTVNDICSILDDVIPADQFHHSDLIEFVKDRPGHDQKYALNNSKILSLGWKPKIDWNHGIRSTIEWYLNNKKYLISNAKDSYSGERLGQI